MTFAPLTPDRWNDFETLFGPRGACSGCWCMSWRYAKKADFDRNKGENNRRALKKIVDDGGVTGVLAYDDGKPVGWCAIAPRSEFARLENHRTLKPLDDAPVWSIVCLFIAREYRHKGVSAQLIKAAADHARSQGAQIVEAYPTDPGQSLPAPFLYTGIVSAFEKAGFTEAARPARTRAIMRKKFRAN